MHERGVKSGPNYAFLLDGFAECQMLQQNNGFISQPFLAYLWKIDDVAGAHAVQKESSIKLV